MSVTSPSNTKCGDGKQGRAGGRRSWDGRGSSSGDGRLGLSVFSTEEGPAIWAERDGDALPPGQPPRPRLFISTSHLAAESLSTGLSLPHRLGAGGQPVVQPARLSEWPSAIGDWPVPSPPSLAGPWTHRGRPFSPAGPVPTQKEHFVLGLLSLSALRRHQEQKLGSGRPTAGELGGRASGTGPT